jgi:glycosyltransferase involved in cell wall biosynthesis
MLERWREGFEVVVAKRCSRLNDSFIKRVTASLFYRINNRLSDISIPENCGDFRLMDRKVVDALRLLPESQRFMKGLFPWVGFRTTTIEYERMSRIAGNTKFKGWKLWNFALDGITGFSTMPLRVWTYIGLSIATSSIIFGLFIALNTIIYGIELPGYSSLITAITLLGGLQLMGIGILGEYLGRTLIEAKRRPIFIIRHTYKNGDN